MTLLQKELLSKSLAAYAGVITLKSLLSDEQKAIFNQLYKENCLKLEKELLQKLDVKESLNLLDSQEPL